MSFSFFVKSSSVPSFLYPVLFWQPFAQVFLVVVLLPLSSLVSAVLTSFNCPLFVYTLASCRVSMYASLLMFGLSLVVYLMDLCISWGLIESKASLNKDSFFVDFFPPHLLAWRVCIWVHT